MRILCIGAGASGLFFALNCADEKHEVILVDKNHKVGRKMYISGKGRCNITNNCEVKEFISNIVNNPKFLYSAISLFKPADTISFFNEHGCMLKTERGNRVFPVSDHASDIIDTLFFECKKKKVRIVFEETIREIKKKENQFVAFGEKGNYTIDKVVVATGGLSYPVTGSTGDGYRFAESFGHTIVEPKPALCPIKIKEKIDKQMLKLTLKNVALSANNDHFHQTIFGDLEFLNDAISGPIVLSLSSLINREKQVNLSLDLKPALKQETLDKRLLREIEKHPDKDVAYLLSILLPKEFISFFLRLSKIDSSLPLSSLPREKRLELLKNLKELPLTFEGLEQIEKGIVTSGGISVKQINPKTMESKLCEGLYFIGEVLDVDGLTGGFNLQIALSCGYNCAKAIKEG